MRISTPKSHISALLSGARGMGDQLAAKIEQKMDKPAGWMDLPIESGNVTELPRPDLTPDDRALLQDVKMLPEERLAEIRAEAARWRALTDEMLAKRIAVDESVPRLPHLGGIEALDDLHEVNKSNKHPNRPKKKA